MSKMSDGWIFICLNCKQIYIQLIKLKRAGFCNLKKANLGKLKNHIIFYVYVPNLICLLLNAKQKANSYKFCNVIFSDTTLFIIP